MSKDLIAALEAIAAIKNKDFGSDWEEIEEARFIAERALSRHRSSVESVELPEGDAFKRDGWGPDCGPYVEMHMASEMSWRDKADWTPLYTATTVRSLIAAAVERERELCAKVCEGIEDEYQRTEGRRYPELKSDAQKGAGDCAAAIRARGEK